MDFENGDQTQKEKKKTEDYSGLPPQLQSQKLATKLPCMGMETRLKKEKLKMVQEFRHLE